MLFAHTLKKLPTTRDLVQAVIAGEVERVREMHAAGVSVMEPDQYGWLPIHRAAANDRAEVIRLLVDWGSPLEATGSDGWTPLHLASVSRSPHAVRALLDAGADIHARSKFGATPLHLAVGPTITEPLLDTVRVLVSSGADPTAADNEGKSPLDEARKIGHAELQKILGDDPISDTTPK
jgi:ankyrin repeat protein